MWTVGGGDMQRRSGSKQPTKVQRGGRKARKAATSHISASDLHEDLDQRTRERDEALEQLAATSDVLHQRITSGPAAKAAAFKGRIHGCTRTFR